MNPTAKIYIAGHRGLVGSALMRNLTTPSPSRGEGRGEGEIYTNLLTRTHAELDLTDQTAVEGFFATEKPDYVFLAAAKVGSILAGGYTHPQVHPISTKATTGMNTQTSNLPASTAKAMDYNE